MNVYQALLRDGAAKRAALEVKGKAEMTQFVTVDRATLEQMVAELQRMSSACELEGDKHRDGNKWHRLCDAAPAPQAHHVPETNFGNMPKIGCVQHDCDECKSRAAQPLTDEQIKSMWQQYCGYPGGIIDFARAIEAAHGIGEG